MIPSAGTNKVAESYKFGTRTTDIMLEILNLDKKEVISIDGISNQEFSEVSRWLTHHPKYVFPFLVLDTLLFSLLLTVCIVFLKPFRVFS
jgi:hypothetical protein